MAPTKEVEEEKKVLVGAEPEVKSPEGEERKVGEVEIHVEPHREGGLGMESGLSVDERVSVVHMAALSPRCRVTRLFSYCRALDGKNNTKQNLVWHWERKRA